MATTKRSHAYELEGAAESWSHEPEPLHRPTQSPDAGHGEHTPSWRELHWNPASQRPQTPLTRTHSSSLSRQGSHMRRSARQMFPDAQELYLRRRASLLSRRSSVSHVSGVRLRRRGSMGSAVSEIGHTRMTEAAERRLDEDSYSLQLSRATQAHEILDRADVDFDATMYTVEEVELVDAPKYIVAHEEASRSGQISVLTPYQRARYHTWVFLERTSSSKAAFAFTLWILFLILASTCAMILETEKGLTISQDVWDGIELFCVVFFSIEVVLRAWVSQSVCQYLRSPLNVVDVVAVLPFYIQVLLSTTGISNLRLLRTVRLIRLARLFKVSRSFQDMQLFISVVYNSMVSLGGLGLLLLILITTVSAIVFYLESTVPQEAFDEHPVFAKNPFTSIPQAMYFAMTSITSVGYGDIYPIGTIGRIAVGMLIMLGSTITTMPLSIITTTYQKEAKKRDMETLLSDQGLTLPSTAMLKRLHAQITDPTNPLCPQPQLPKLQHKATPQECEALAVIDAAEQAMHAKLDLLVLAVMELDSALIRTSAFSNKSHLGAGMFD